MSVYVDAPIWPYRNMMMCHMIADTTEELLQMADKIGVQRKWIQHTGTHREHFDISKSKRVLAVKAGAKEIDKYELVSILKSKKQASELLKELEE